VSDETFVTDYLDHLTTTLRADDLPSWLSEAKSAMESVKERKGRVWFAGNGASASMASHYALDFTKQVGIDSSCFNNAALITAYANDFGYEDWVARAIEHHAGSGDLAVLISSSGRSPNMLKAADSCRSLGVQVLSFTGFESTNDLRERSDVGFWADSRAYNVIESVHAAWLGILCDLIIGAREYSVS